MPINEQINPVVQTTYAELNKALEQAYGGEVIATIDTTKLSDVFDYVTSNTERTELFYGALFSRFREEIYNTRIFKREFNLPIWRDSVRFGAIVLKTYVEPIEATENEEYTIQNGEQAIMFEVSLADVKSATIENKQTWQVELTILHRQLDEAFTSVEKLNAFFNQQLTTLSNAMEMTFDRIERTLLTKLMAIKIKKGGNGVVKLLTLYKNETGVEITPVQALKSKEFIRFMNMTIADQLDLLQTLSVNYNVEGFKRQTPKENMVVCVSNKMARASEYYLESDTYHNQLVALPQYNEIKFLQNLGTGSLEDVTSIDVTINGVNTKQSYIMGIAFDDMTLGACLSSRTSVSEVWKRKGATHHWERAVMQYFIDPSENAVLFILE